MTETDSKLNALQQTQSQINHCIQTVKHQTNKLLRESEQLMKQRKQLKQEQEQVEVFVKEYLLSEDEKAILLEADPELLQSTEHSHFFFDALDKLEKISANSNNTSNSNSNIISSAFRKELFEELFVMQERAYEVLYRCAKEMIGEALQTSTPELKPIVRQCIQSLRHRTVYLQYVHSYNNTCIKLIS